MAGQPGLKSFYIGLAVVAIGGAGAIWWARQSSADAERATVVNPLPVTGEAFAGYTLGSDSAPIDVIEYGDFQCPACAQFAVLTVPDLKQRLVATGQIRWTFRDFPLEQHQNAIPAHLGAACADEQGRFWEMHDQLYFRHRDWATERRAERRIRDLAEAVGLDMGRYDECVRSGRYLGRIAATRQAGAEMGVRSTPTLFIGNLRVAGALSYDSVKALVDRVVGNRP